MHGQRAGVVEGERRLKVGFEDVFGRRQNIGNQILAEHDLTVKRASNLQIRQRQGASQNHGGKPKRHDNPKDRHACFDTELHN